MFTKTCHVKKIFKGLKSNNCTEKESLFASFKLRITDFYKVEDACLTDSRIYIATNLEMSKK